MIVNTKPAPSLCPYSSVGRHHAGIHTRHAHSTNIGTCTSPRLSQPCRPPASTTIQNTQHTAHSTQHSTCTARAQHNTARAQHTTAHIHSTSSAHAHAPMPSEYMSADSVHRCPMSCSGAAYIRVPAGAVRPPLPTHCATPRSATWARRSADRSTLLQRSQQGGAVRGGGEVTCPPCELGTATPCLDLMLPCTTCTRCTPLVLSRCALTHNTNRCSAALPGLHVAVHDVQGAVHEGHGFSHVQRHLAAAAKRGEQVGRRCTACT